MRRHAGGYVQLLDFEASYSALSAKTSRTFRASTASPSSRPTMILNPLAPFLNSATDDSVATPGSLSLSF